MPSASFVQKRMVPSHSPIVWPYDAALAMQSCWAATYAWWSHASMGPHVSGHINAVCWYVAHVSASAAHVLPVTARMSASDVSLVGTAAQTPQAFGQMSLIANLTELLPMLIVEGVTPSARKQYDVESSFPASIAPSTLPSDAGFAPLITSVHDIAPSDTSYISCSKLYFVSPSGHTRFFHVGADGGGGGGDGGRLHSFFSVFGFFRAFFGLSFSKTRRGP